MNPVSLGLRYGLNLFAMVARQQGYPTALAVSSRSMAREMTNLVRAVRLSRQARRAARPGQAPPAVYSEALLAALAGLDLEIRPYHVDAHAFQAHVKAGAYPRYYAAGSVAQGGAREKKLLEYFVSLDLLKPERADTVVDVGSEWSIFPEVLRRLTGARVYRQDLIYPAGVHGDQIGGSATAMPVADEFADQIVLHNAFEHFEGMADTGFILEAWRVLKPGGKVCILPLFLSEHHFVFSDPLVDRRGVVWDPGAPVIEKPWFHNRFGRYYGPAALQQRVLGPARRAGFAPALYHLVNVRQVVPESRMHFALLLGKPAQP
jgi:hypothetical protein